MAWLHVFRGMDHLMKSERELRRKKVSLSHAGAETDHQELDWGTVVILQATRGGSCCLINGLG
jgi:hypothetical protein